MSDAIDFKPSHGLVDSILEYISGKDIKQNDKKEAFLEIASVRIGEALIGYIANLGRRAIAKGRREIILSSRGMFNEEFSQEFSESRIGIPYAIFHPIINKSLHSELSSFISANNPIGGEYGRLMIDAYGSIRLTDILEEKSLDLDTLMKTHGKSYS